MNLKAVFFGTPEFVLPSLIELSQNQKIELKYIVSMPDRPSGRGQQLHSPPAILYAKEKNIPYFQTENINKEEDFLKKLTDEKIDVFIVLAFAQFFGERLLKLPRLGCFNIHTSLLPKFRGSSPIQHALLEGETVTGVTIQKMIKKMDAGDICHQSEISIVQTETCETLSKKLSEQSANSLNLFIDNIINDNLTYTKQDESRATFAKIIQKSDGHINFADEDASLVLRKFQAYDPWPGVFCFLDNKRLKILKLSLVNSKIKKGQYDLTTGQFLVGCLQGSIRLEEVQLEGKKVLTDSDFINGVKSQGWEFVINKKTL